MTRSIRWKLLAWYAVLATAMICMSGVFTYVTIWRSMDRELVDRLTEQASGLAAVLVANDDGTFFVDLSAEQVERYQQEQTGAPYYRIWNARGEMVDTSHPRLQIDLPKTAGTHRGNGNLQIAMDGPAGTRILVARGIQAEQRQLRNLAATSLVVGFVVLAVMLGGGWFLTNRALAPIARITSAAASVSASNLSERIDVHRMETELAVLAETINAAFDRLQAAFERQTRFAADASHELRTPLSIILAQSDLALKRERTPAEYEQALATIRRAASRMKSVVHSLLTLARIDSGQAMLQTEQLDLKVLIEEVMCLLQSLADGKRVSINGHLQPINIVADRSRITEAVTNLLSNAIQHNDAGGTVDLDLTPSQMRSGGPCALLTVRDSGPGIPEADQPFVFDRFFRVDRSRQSGGGSGLGLAITQWIALAHGGELTLQSQPGSGSTFSLRLPCNPVTIDRSGDESAVDPIVTRDAAAPT